MLLTNGLQVIGLLLLLLQTCFAQDTNECLTLPCLNYGTCINKVDGYTCQCHPGYGGKNCETTVPKYFDCRRDDSTCQSNGACSSTTGECTCTNVDTAGYNCKGLPTLASGSVCDSCDSSVTGGAYGCFTFGGTATCFCKMDKIGADCTTPRGTVTCDGARMKVTMEFFTQPQSVYIAGHGNDANCKVTPTSTTVSIDFSLTTGCGAAAIGTTLLEGTPNIGDTTYKNWIVAQYMDGVNSPLDGLFEATCVMSTESLYPVTGKITEAAFDPMRDLNQITLDDAVLDLFEFKVLLSTLAPVSGPVQVGANLLLSLKMKNQDVYKSATFHNCRMSTDLAGTKVVFMIQNGCPVKSGEGLHALRGEPYTDASTEYLPFAAIRFDGQNEVYFLCDVKMCLTTCEGCVRTLRKRRAVTQGDEVERTAITKIVVVDRFETFDHTTTLAPSIEETQTEQNELEMVLTPALVGLGVAVLLSSLVSAYLVVKYRRLRQSIDKHDRAKHEDLQRKNGKPRAMNNRSFDGGEYDAWYIRQEGI